MLDYDMNYQFQAGGNEYLPQPDTDATIIGSNEIHDPTLLYSGSQLVNGGHFGGNSSTSNEIYADPQYAPQSMYFPSPGAQGYHAEAATANFGRTFSLLQQQQQQQQQQPPHPLQQQSFTQYAPSAEQQQQQQQLPLQVPVHQEQLHLQQQTLPIQEQFPSQQPQHEQQQDPQAPVFSQLQPPPSHHPQQQMFYSYLSHQLPANSGPPANNLGPPDQAVTNGLASAQPLFSYDTYSRPDTLYAPHPYLDGFSETLKSQSPSYSEPSPRMSALKNSHLGQVSNTFSSISSTSSSHMFNGSPLSTGYSGNSPTSKPTTHLHSGAQSIITQLQNNPRIWAQMNSNNGSINTNGSGKSSSKKGCFKCSHCKDIFSNLYDLAEHLDRYEIRRSHFCPVEDCPWSIIGLSRKAELRRHCVLQHFLRGRLKDLAAQSIQPDSRLKMVKLLYSCNKSNCGKHFYRKDSLQRHQRLVHENKDSKFNRKWKK